MPVMERVQRSAKTREGESERSVRSKRAKKQQQLQPSLGNQATLRRMAARRRQAGEPAREPDTAEGKAGEVVGRFESDPFDQSGRTRADLNGMGPEQRDEVMGRVRDNVSETQFSRIEKIAGEPGPRSPEAPPKEIRPGAPEGVAPEPFAEAQLEEGKAPEAEAEAKTGAEERKPVEPGPGVKESEARGTAEAPEKEKTPEEEQKKEKKTEGETKKEEKKPAVEPAQGADKAKAADTGKGEKPEKQKASEETTKSKEKGDEESAKAAKAGKSKEDQKARVASAETSPPGQAQVGQALSQLPAESKAGAVAPAAPGPSARQAAAQGGPAVVTTGAETAESGGGGGGDAGTEAALEEGAAEGSPQQAEADKTEEKMAGAETATEPEAEAEPPEPAAKTESEEDFKKQPTAEDQEAIKEAEQERREQTRNPEGVAAAPEAEEEQEPAPAPAQVDPAEARAGLNSLAEGMGGGGEPSGGGGGGGAISEQPEPAPPKVESLPPVAAVSAIGGLKVGQISSSLAGVQSAVSQKMSAEHADLQANAPSMERPSGSPQTRQAPIQFPNGAGAAKGTLEETAPGEAVAIEQPQPLSDPGPAPTDQVAAPPIQGGGEGGTLTQADADNVQTAVDEVPTSDPALDQTSGPPPTVELTGEANPQRAADQRAQLDQSIVEQQQQGTRDAAQPMGENEIYSVAPKETLTAKIPEVGGGAAGSPPPAVDDETTAIVAEEKQGDEVRASAQQASGDMQAGEQERAANFAQEKADHEAKVQDLEAKNTAEQTDARNTAGQQVQQLRGKWSQGQQEAVDKAHGDADAAQESMSSEVESQRQQGNRNAAAEIDKGNQQAANIKANAQSDAEKEKAKAKKESSGGILGWIASKAKAFFEGLKKAVHAVFDLARKALKTLIDSVKKLAAAAIDLARNAIVSAIRLAGKALIAIGDVALAAFPGLRDKFRSFIEDSVKAAEDTVNKLADALKEGINKLLDLLGAALNGLLNLLEKAYMAAIDIVAGAVQAAIKVAQAAIALLGLFAAIIKDIATHPLQWLSNLGAAIVDGIKNHLWKAFKEAVKNWFFSKLEEVLGIGMAIFNILFKGGIKLAEIGKMAFEGLKAAIPAALIGILVEKLVAMIVPAAGAIMAIIEGLQAAWGTITRILQAIEKFISFLKAVKSGGAGLKFAEVLAGAAIVVIDFVANWLIRKIRGPAGKIGSKIKAIAKKILEKLKAVAKKIGGAIKKAFKKVVAKIKGAYKKVKEKLFGKKKGKGKESKKKKQSKEQKDHERLNKALGVIRPGARSMIASHASSWRLKAKLFYWKLRYRLSKLALVRQGNQELVEAAASPTQIAAQAIHLESNHLHKIIREVADQLMLLPEVRHKVEQLVEQRAAGSGATEQNPLQASPSPLVTGADIAQNPRTRAREFFEVGEAPGAKATGTIFRPATSPPNVKVAAPGVGVPTYPNLVSQLPSGIGGPATAGLLQQFHETGVLPPAMPQPAVQTVGALSLITGVEVARDPAHAVRYAAALEAMKNGRATPEDVFILKNPLAPKKQSGFPSAPRTASEINRTFDPTLESKFKTPLKGAEAKNLPQSVDQFLAKEKQIMIAWMESRMVGTDPLFSTEEEARSFIRQHMYDYLIHLGRSTFGV